MKTDEPAYGYEMTRRLSERGLSVVAEGSIYPLLGGRRRRIGRVRVLARLLRRDIGAWAGRRIPPAPDAERRARVDRLLTSADSDVRRSVEWVLRRTR